MNTKSIIEIFRGDDSDALGYQTIVGTIHTDLDLTGCKAVFRYLGFFQEFDPIPEDKKLTIVIPSASSMQFPPGFGYASLKVYDIDRKVRTFTNRIPVFVKTMTPCIGGGEFDVEFSPFPELAPLKIFKGPNAEDFDLYTGFVSKIIDRASLTKYGLVMLADAMSEDGGNSGKAASPAAVKAAYDSIIATLVDNYYTAEQTDEAIDRVAAYYITYTAAGAAFPTYAALANATTVYSGGKVRVPTRNDYCVVLADETHDGSEYRYIYAVAEGQTTGTWQAQFPVEGVMTIDQTVTKDSTNPVASGGVWSAIWGTATTAFSSLYDWCVSQLAGKANAADATLTQHYTDWVCSPAETQGEYPTSYFVAWGTIPSTEIETWCLYIGIPGDADYVDHVDERTPDLPNITSATFEGVDGETVTATRTASGYRLGPDSESNPNRDKPVASEDEAEALRTALAGKQDALSAQQLANIAAVSDALAFDATHSYAAGDPVVYNGTLYTFTAAHSGAWTGRDVSAVNALALIQALQSGKLDSDGLTNSSGGYLSAAGLKTNSGVEFPYATLNEPMNSGAALTDSDIFDSASPLGAAFAGKANCASNPTAGNLAALDASGNPTDSQIPKTDVALKGNIPYSLVTQPIVGNAVLLEDRASNSVTISATLSPNTLTINFPTATSGKVRDFAMRLNIAAGVTAPEIAWPQGVTLENNGGEVPEISDGGTGGSSTILYFSETENDGTTAKFLVKGETLTAIAQA